MKKHLFALITLLFLTIFTWHKILSQSLMGEGYYYFGYSLSDFSSLDKFVRHDKGALLIFDFLKNIFRDNVFYYQLLVLITLIILGILFYLLVYELVEKKSVAFFAGVIFSINYNGAFEMVAIGNYQFFVQRVIYFLLLFPSALFLVRFLKTKQNRHFAFSVLFYIVSLFLSKFSMFFLPFLLAYLFVFLIFSTRQIKEKCLMGLYAIFYIFPTFILYQAESAYSSTFLLRGQNFFTFLINERATIIEQLQLQFTVLFVPGQVLLFYSKVLGYTLKNSVSSLYLPLLIFCALITLYIIRKYKTLRIPIISSFIFIPIVFILNIFTRGSDFIENVTPGSRYLYVPSIGFSIIFSIFLFALFSYKSVVLKSIVVIIIVCLIYSNTQMIQSEINRDFYKHIAAKKSIKYIKTISPRLATDSFIVVPSVLSYYGAVFCQKFYGKEKTIFAPFFSEWTKELKRPFDSKKDYILEYDYGEGKVIDSTKDYREIIKEKNI